MEQHRNAKAGGGGREIPEKTRRPAASPGTISTCQNSEATSSGGERSSHSATAGPLKCRIIIRTIVVEHVNSDGRVAGELAVTGDDLELVAGRSLAVQHPSHHQVAPVVHCEQQARISLGDMVPQWWRRPSVLIRRRHPQHHRACRRALLHYHTTPALLISHGDAFTLFRHKLHLTLKASKRKRKGVSEEEADVITKERTAGEFGDVVCAAEDGRVVVAVQQPHEDCCGGVVPPARRHHVQQMLGLYLAVQRLHCRQPAAVPVDREGACVGRQRVADLSRGAFVSMAHKTDQCLPLLEQSRLFQRPYFFLCVYGLDDGGGIVTHDGGGRCPAAHPRRWTRGRGRCGRRAGCRPRQGAAGACLCQHSHHVSVCSLAVQRRSHAQPPDCVHGEECWLPGHQAPRRTRRISYQPELRHHRACNTRPPLHTLAPHTHTHNNNHCSCLPQYPASSNHSNVAFRTEGPAPSGQLLWNLEVFLEAVDGYEVPFSARPSHVQCTWRGVLQDEELAVGLLEDWWLLLRTDNQHLDGHLLVEGGRAAVLSPHEELQHLVLCKPNSQQAL
ncbi:hypothetical protein PR048_004084 [Dryococelus australis]|uniref:Uncharacterized protein n=1 Tax=Dryococelus australis TaxID=614101 RepID=A0ABQ9I4J9_9NEOP|nr:hypothetical protein PR048_004084 [Dryococelus australis]